MTATDASSDLLTRHQRLAHQVEPVKRRKTAHGGSLVTDERTHSDVPDQRGDLVEDTGRYRYPNGNVESPAGRGLSNPLTSDAFTSAPAFHNGFDLQTSDFEVWLNPSDAAAGYGRADEVQDSTLVPTTTLPGTFKLFEKPIPIVHASEDQTSNGAPPEMMSTECATAAQSELGLPHFNADSFLEDGDFFLEGFQLPVPSHHQVAGETSHIEIHTPDPVIESAGAGSEFATSDQQRNSHNVPVQESSVFSRIGSPLPASRTIPNLDSPGGSEYPTGVNSKQPCWKVSQEDYQQMQASIDDAQALLPNDFTLPTRHMISHCLERCINSLYKHQPCVHIPTFRPAQASLALVLAMCAVGAQLRFESGTGLKFFHASKALIMAQLQEHHMQSIVNRLSSAPPSSVCPGHPLGRDGTQQGSGQLDRATRPRSRLQTMQALLTLMSFGSWGPKALLAETMTLQSMLAMLAREEGLSHEPAPVLDASVPVDEQWSAWIDVESARRIKSIAYYFTNLQSLAYNMVPPLLTAELQCFTPASAAEWAAPNSRRWDEARRMSGIVAVPFYPLFEGLFQPEDDNGAERRSPVAGASVSAMGNYTLIFAILQCIYFLRQRHPFPSSAASATLKSETAYPTAIPKPNFNTIAVALHRWQGLWEACPESTIEPEAKSGPISFNSIACLRLAWIRLFADLGPCRNLATRDSTVIGEVFNGGPAIPRHPQLTPVLLQAIHALSVPVRLGVKFVSRSQTMFWSVNQSLCTLECAVVLHRWFASLLTGITASPLTGKEIRLLSMLSDIVAESGCFEDDELAVLKGDSSSARGRSHLRSGNTAPAGLRTSNTVNHEDGLTDGSFSARANGWIAENTPQPTSTEVEDNLETWQKRIRALSIAVARLWAEVFSNSHVFDLVTTIGRTLSARPEVQKSVVAAP